MIVFAGGGDSGVCVMGGGITDMCGRVHAITETLFFPFILEYFNLEVHSLSVLFFFF